MFNVATVTSDFPAGGGYKKEPVRRRIRRAVAFGAAALAVIAGVGAGVTLAPTDAVAAVSSDKQQVIAINTASLNGNAVRGANETSSDATMDDYAHFYSAGLISDGGLPTSGKITAPTSNISYQLSWTGDDAYDGNDCIRLVNGDATKTMELASYGAYEQVYVLATAGGPGPTNYANFTVTLTYTDGSTSTTTYKLYDWYDTTKVTNVEQIASYKRQVNNSSGTDGTTTGGPILHSAAIEADKTKLLKSITFKSNGKNETGSNKGIYSTIYAVTGVVDKSAPATPVATPATNVGSASFTANWNSVSGATSYVIDVATDENFSNMVSGYNNKNVGNTTSAEISVPNIGNQTYYYRVRAVNSSGQSLSSNVITVNTIAALKVTKTVAVASSSLTAPTKYYLEDGTEVDGFTFKFTVPTSASGYEAQVYNADGTNAGSSFRITNGYTQTIKGGQYILVYGLSAGDEVTVQELTEDAKLAPKGFALTSRTKAGQEQSGRGNSIEATITAATGETSAQNILNFTNTYKPESYTIEDGTFTAKKVLEGREWNDADSFTIRIKAPAGTPMPTELDVTTDSAGYQVVTKDVTKQNKDDLLTCGAITYTEPGTYYYTLNEAIPDERAQGMTYSAAEYTATITIGDDGKGGLCVKSAEFVQNLDDDGNPVSNTISPTGGVYVGTFTNEFNQTSANVTAEVTKSYTNNDTGASLEKNQFTFEMEALGGYDSDTATLDLDAVDGSIVAPMPQSANGTTVTAGNMDDGVATFPAITYTTSHKGKAYVYELTEVNDGVAGVDYDESVYYMVVRVKSEGAGITVTREYYNASAEKIGDRPAFSNSYDVLPATAGADSYITGTKTIEGRGWNEGETYAFMVTPDTATAAAIEAGNVTNVERRVTASTPAEGNTATFTANPVGANAMTFKKSGTYTFTVAESYAADTATSGITYDSHVGKVIYTVTDTHEKDDETDKSKLAVSVSYENMGFTNTYEASGVFTGVNVTNTLNGRALDGSKFSFEVQGLSYDGEQPSIAVPTEITVPNGDNGQKTVLTNADGSALLSANIDESMVGKVQAFAIRETSPEAAGYTFDTENSGAALVLVEVRAKADMPSSLYTVTRVYKGEAVSELLDGGTEISSSDIDALGSPVQTIDASQTGDKPTVDFVNKYEASLDYGAMSNLKIHVALAYEDGSAVTDRTHAFEVLVKPVATDTVSAEEAGKHLTSAPAGKLITTGQMVPSAKTDAWDNAYVFNLSDFNFGAFTQDDAGKTFAFDTSEVQETVGVDGYTFDANTYRTWIAVADNGDGTLTATTTVKKMNADGTEGDEVGTSYTCSTNTEGSGSTYVPFANTYKAYPPADYTPQVVKVVTGKSATADETFSFKMVAADEATRTLMDAGMLTDSTTGQAITSGMSLTASTSGAIAENASQVVSFDKLVFNEVGTYKFNITEDIPNDVAGWNYDEHTYVLTVSVRDSGGKLTAEASGSSTQGGNRFANTYSTTTTLGKEGGFDVEKILHGRTLRAGEFTFKAEGTDDASKAKVNVLQGAQDGAVTVTNEGLNSDGQSVTGLLEGLSFSNSDRGETFNFKVTEVAGSVAATTYDSNYYLVAITPYEPSEGSGELKLKVVATKYDAAGVPQGEPEEYDSNNGTVNPIVVTFENTYKATGTWPLGDDDALRANVTLTGRDLEAGELYFNVYAVKTDGTSMLKVSEGTNVAAKDGEAAKITLPQLELNLGEGMGQQKLDLLKAVEYNYAQKVLKDDGSATYELTFRMVEDTTRMPSGVRSVSGDPSRTVRLVVTDNGQGQLTAQVEYRSGDTTGSVEFYDVYDKVKTVTAVGASEDLDGKVLSAGGSYTYHINWVNDATEVVDDVRTSIASTVTITDALPAGVEFVSATNGGSYDSDTRVVTWTLEDCAARSYGSVGVTVRVKSDPETAASSLENQAHIKVDSGSEYDSNKTSSSVLSKTTSAGDGATVKVGDEITYTVGYANDTDDVATVTLTDTLPAGVEFVEASDGGQNDGGIVTWTLGNVPSGKTGTVTVKVRVLASAVDKALANSATMRIGDDVREVQTATATNYVKSGNLKISKTVSSESGVDAPDATFTFKVTLMDANGNALPSSEQYRVSGDVAGYAFNGVTFNLKEDQSVVIGGLPEGYTYRVDETSSAEGFEAKQATFEGTIRAEETAEASFVNEYTPDDVRLDGSSFLKVAKELSGREWQQNDKFTFKLTRADEGGNAPLPQGGGDTVELTYNKREGSFGSIDYSKVGVYTYYVTETESKTDDNTNLTSSLAKYQVNVIVTDAGEESGKLEVEVSAVAVLDDNGKAVGEDEQEVSDYTYRFTNAYATAQDLTITNTVSSGDKLSPSKDQEFKYTVELEYEDGTKVNGEFGGLTFVDGKASFTLKDGESKTLSGLPDNATYAVTQEKVDAYTTKVDGEETNVATGSVSSDSETSVSFTNGYGVKPTDPISISANVVLEGRDFTADDRDYSMFVYKLMQGDEEKQSKSPLIDLDKSEATLRFEEISFDTPGMYTYTFTDAKAGETVNGVAHDSATHTVTITVTDDGLGKLHAAVQYDDLAEGVPTFTNTYTASAATDSVSGSMSVTPSEGNSYELKADQFGFTLKNTSKPEGCTTIYPDTTVNNAEPASEGDLSASFGFADLTFPVAGTYTFTVTEDVDITEPGVSDSGKVFEVTFVVADNGEGEMEVTEKTIAEVGEDGSRKPVSYISFAKTYDPTRVSFTVSGTKVLKNTDKGTTRTVKDGEFSFKIAAANDASASYLPESTTALNAGTAFKFGAITYDRVGDYAYTVSEVAGNDTTITYDAHECTINVKVVDEDGVLKVSKESSVSPTDGLTFTNSFTPAAVSGEAISGNVSLDGRDADEGEFTIKVTDKDGNVVEVTPDADGNFSLDAPTFDKTGVYTYTVSQEPGERGGMTYDNTVYTVTYKVTENPETHELVVEREITKTDGSAESETADAIEFKNEYAPVGKPKADVSAKVDVSGKDLGEGDFTVIVVDKDGNVVAEAKNNADGTVDLSGIELPGPGTYTFTVKEKATDAEGVTIDSKEYTVTIVVEDDLNGGYNVKVTYDGLADGEVPTFSNTYTAPSDGDGKGGKDDKNALPQTGDAAAVIAAIAAAGATVAALGHFTRRRTDA